jgi:hypothetical protein
MQEIKIKIKTPKGEAKSAQWKLRPFLLGNFQKIKETHISPDDDEIMWVIEADVRKCSAITMRVNLYDSAIKWAFTSKAVKWAMKKSTRKDQEVVRDMIKNGTTIEVIKTASYDEWVKEKKPFWKRVFD